MKNSKKNSKPLTIYTVSQPAQKELFSVNDYLKMSRRGNPRFVHKYSSESPTKVIRVPDYLADQIIMIAHKLDRGEKISFDSVTPSNQTIENTIATLPVDQILCDPKKFQFRICRDSVSGESGSLKGVTQWNPDFAGLIQVWCDPSTNFIYVVNGHNRLALAKRLGVTHINVKFLENCNTSKEAMVLGAIANMIQNNANLLDIAKILRESKITIDQLKKLGVNMTAKLSQDALNVSQLNEYLFIKVLTGDLPLSYAPVIGSLSQNDQDKMYKLIKNKLSLSINELIEIKDSVLGDQSEISLFDAFGNAFIDTSFITEKARLTSLMKTRLRNDKSILKAVAKSKNEHILNQTGNQINKLNSVTTAEKLDKYLSIFDTLKNTKHPISESLSNATKRILNGENKKLIENELFDELLVRLHSELDTLDLIM